VSEAVETELDATSSSLTRCGANRYDTAAKLANEALGGQGAAAVSVLM